MEDGSEPFNRGASLSSGQGAGRGAPPLERDRKEDETGINSILEEKKRSG